MLLGTWKEQNASQFWQKNKKLTNPKLLNSSVLIFGINMIHGLNIILLFKHQ